MKQKLVAVTNSKKLMVEPIWDKPIDDIEGPLYQDYRRRHPGYRHVYVRSALGPKLIKASQRLPEHLMLIVRAGHRPLDVQYQLLDMVKRSYLEKNPEANDKQALDFARQYVSDPAIKKPPHCCGAAVDVDVFDQNTDSLLDFGCPVNTDDEIAHLGTKMITPEQQANRDILHSAMLGAGFAPYQTEWWHFSYGDDTWAEYYQKDGPIYGLLDI